MGLQATMGTTTANGHTHLSADGVDATEAIAFVNDVLANFPLGKFEQEQEMIERLLHKHSK
jgi:hypothetical protein